MPQADFLEIYEGDNILGRADVAIVVPLDAPDFPGKLAGITSGSMANAKHTFHTLSQIALIDFEDQMLELETIPEKSTLIVKDKKCDTPIEQGLIISRDEKGKIRVFVHAHVDAHHLLKFAHRHCTRWIRLDI